MSFFIKELAKKIGAEAIGNVNKEVFELVPITQAASGSIAPLFRKKYLEFGKVAPTAVIATRKLADEAVRKGAGAAIIHAEPVVALARLIDVFYPEDLALCFVHPSAIIAASASIHETAWIGPGAVIEENVQIGERTWIGPNAVICRGSILGRFVRIGPGAVIGYEGFGFIPTAGDPIKLRQIGYVELQDFVEIGAGACVDRGTLGKTVIGASSKLDNLVQIGHNVEVGRGVLVAAQSGIAGSVVVGDGVMLGGQTGVADHLCLGNGAKVTAQSGVTRDVNSGEIVSGTPAIDRKVWLRSLASLIAASRDGKSDKG